MDLCGGVVRKLKCRYKSASKCKVGEGLCKTIRNDIDRNSGIFFSPFGVKKVHYCDYTASGRPLLFIENFITKHILPMYGIPSINTAGCFINMQMQKFIKDSEDIVRKCLNASFELYYIIFVGSGCTGAVNCLIRMLQLSKLQSQSNSLIIVSAYEHHSNLLPWRESGLPMVRLTSRTSGKVDIQELKAHLDNAKAEGKRLIICSLTAASNITGIVADFDPVCEIVHKYGGYVFWDYATAAPYIDIDMDRPGLAYKDAVFLSMHKFVGGPGCPGILAVKKSILTENITRSDVNPISIIRTGMTFRLKDLIGTEYIRAQERKAVELVKSRFGKSKVVNIVGDLNAEHRLPIFAFLIKHIQSGKLIHHNFVGKLFNDLFGIQTRTGCVCAAPYTQDLLNVFEKILASKFTDYQTHRSKDRVGTTGTASCPAQAISKPGFCRLNISYFFNKIQCKHIVDALEFIGNHGWKFLPQYTFDSFSGSWRHRDFDRDDNPIAELMTLCNAEKVQSLILRKRLTKFEAKRLLENAFNYANEAEFNLESDLLPIENSNYSWFLTPKQAASYMACRSESNWHL